MADAFNPYREWLGLEGQAANGQAANGQAPNYYELLAIAANETDASRITLAGEQASRKVRSFRPGANAAAWSRLLDEIQTAKETLLDPARRGDYDRSLARASAAAPAAQPAPVRPAAPPNADLYPPGMTRPAPPYAEVSRSEQPRAAKPAEKRDRANSDLDPPMRRSEPANARAGVAPAAAPRPIPVNPAPLADALPPAAASAMQSPGGAATTQPAYAAPVETPTAGLPLAMPAGPYGAGGAPLAAPVAHPMQPYAAPALMAYPAAQMPYAPGALDPMAPVAIPGMPLPVPYTATPYAAPTAQPGGYIAGPMPLGAPLPAPLAAAYAAPVAEAQVELPATRSESAAALARKHEASSQRGLMIAGVSVALMLLTSALAYLAITNLKAPEEVAQQPAAPAVPFVPAGDVQPIERSVEGTLARPAKARDQATPVPGPNRNPAPRPMPDIAPSPMPVPTPENAAPNVDPPSPAPTPAFTPPATSTLEPPMPMVSRAELMELAKALTTAKVALGEMNFQEADAQLAKADSLAKLPKHREMVARLKEVGGYVRQFRQALAAAAMELEGGDVFMVGSSTQVAFVEGGADGVVLRVAGMNRPYPFNDMPAGLAVALADLKLAGSDPVSRVVKGSYLLVHKRADAETFAKAKAWWEEAQNGGVDLARLMPFLSDNYGSLANDSL